MNSNFGKRSVEDPPASVPVGVESNLVVAGVGVGGAKPTHQIGHQLVDDLGLDFGIVLGSTISVEDQLSHMSVDRRFSLDALNGPVASIVHAQTLGAVGTATNHAILADALQLIELADGHGSRDHIRISRFTSTVGPRKAIEVACEGGIGVVGHVINHGSDLDAVDADLLINLGISLPIGGERPRAGRTGHYVVPLQREELSSCRREAILRDRN